MRSVSAFSVFMAAILAPLASAALHKDGICFDNKGGANVYNEAATIAMCGNYKVRNTGGEWWDTCPDCEMKVIGNLNLCHSEEGHIGGDELEYYCTKINGAGGSMAG